MISETFGEMVRRLRHERRLTMAQLAAVLEVSVTFVSDVERGRRGPFQAEQIDRVAALLRVDGSDLHVAAAEAREAVKLDPHRLGRAGTQAIAALSRHSLSDEQWEQILQIAGATPPGSNPK